MRAFMFWGIISLPNFFDFVHYKRKTPKIFSPRSPLIAKS
jgi:hypothetical protein